MLGASGLGCFLGNHVHEVLLGFDEVLHRLAGQFDQLLALVRLPGLGGLHPGVSLLAGNFQELLLHVDESLHAALQQVGNGLRRRPFPDALFDPGHQNFILFLSQFEKDASALQ